METNKELMEAPADLGGDIFDLIREWSYRPEGQRGEVARSIIGVLNRSYMAGVKDTRELFALSQRSEAVPSAAAGEQVQAGEKLREAVLHDGLFDAKESFRRIHESETIGHARNLARIAMLEVSNVLSRYLAQPTPAQGDAVPVNSDALATMLTVFDMGLGFALCHHGFAETRNAIKDLQEDFTEIRIAVANATRQSSVDGGDAAYYRWLKAQPNLFLTSDNGKWEKSNGEKFVASHRLAAGNTQYGAYETLDETIAAAIAAQVGKGEIK